jgi:hypothetical protein
MLNADSVKLYGRIKSKKIRACPGIPGFTGSRSDRPGQIKPFANGGFLLELVP